METAARDRATRQNCAQPHNYRRIHPEWAPVPNSDILAKVPGRTTAITGCSAPARWPSLRASTVETTPDPRNIVCEEKRGEAIRTASPAGLLRSLRSHVSAQPVFPGDAPFFRVSLPVMMRKLDVADKFRTRLLLDTA